MNPLFERIKTIPAIVQFIGIRNSPSQMGQSPGGSAGNAFPDRSGRFFDQHLQLRSPHRRSAASRTGRLSLPPTRPSRRTRDWRKEPSESGIRRIRVASAACADITVEGFPSESDSCSTSSSRIGITAGFFSFTINDDHFRRHRPLACDQVLRHLQRGVTRRARSLRPHHQRLADVRP